MGESKIIADYGSWPSEIDADIVSKNNCKAIRELRCGENSVFWLEQQFPTGRHALFQFKKDNERIIEWTAANVDIRNIVHEYGGGSFIIVDDAPYYTTVDGIFKQVAADSDPEFIAAGNRSHRFADMCYHKDLLYAVYEVHSGNEVENMIVRIVNGAVKPVATGADFYASPRISPSGQHLSWMEWNMPNMPWDETAIVVSSIDENGDVSQQISRISREGINYHSPEWTSGGDLYVIADQTNWWNVYKVSVSEHSLCENIYPVDAEIGAPMWQFAEKHFATNKYGILMDVAGKLIYKHWDGKAERIDCTEFTSFKHLALDEDGFAYAIAAGPAKLSSVIRIHLGTKKVDILHEAQFPTNSSKNDISIPQSVEFHSDGINVQAWFYPPLSKKYAAPEGTLPPVVLLAHGGPTAYSSNTLDMRIQYLTTRGFAVCDVNYRGSTGFGTVFRNMLRRNWGIVDRNDMINAAKYLINQKIVDPKRLCIMGSSAGGYLLLATLLKSDLFSAAASLYGVSDLIGLAKDTHKFEFGYNEQLIGKFPEETFIYQQRSPLKHCDQISTPIAFFHGEEDPVVPLSQSVQLHEALKTKGLPTSLVVFPGEAHGFKGSFANRETLNGIYYFFCRVLGIQPSVGSQLKIENLSELK